MSFIQVKIVLKRARRHREGVVNKSIHALGDAIEKKLDVSL